MRLVKYLAHAGVASRRKAEGLIAAGRVRLGDSVVRDPARDVNRSSDVTVDGKPIAREQREYYLLNKPKGVVSTARDPRGRPKVTDLVSARGRVYPVGRLDAASSGLILLTNDGELANRLTHPRYEVVKTYRVTVAGAVSPSALHWLRRGVKLADGLTAPAKVKSVEIERNASTLEVSIHEGRKRQVRRMCEAVGHLVLELQRVRFGPLTLGKLKSGESRPLTSAEIERLWQNQGP